MMSLIQHAGSATDRAGAVRFVLRCVRFLVLLAVVYVAVLVVLTRMVDSQFLGAWSNIILPGHGHSYLSFREVGDHRDVDLLFVGSSHAYRWFDPRYFDRMGLNSFNLGSTSQTPLNSYYLLREHLGALRPRLVVFEVYPLMLESDGSESALDLVNSLPLSGNLVSMAFASRSLPVLNNLMLRSLTRDARGLAVPSGVYVVRLQAGDLVAQNKMTLLK